MSGEYLAHGATLTLAWFLGINCALSLVVAALCLAAEASPRAWSARFWIALRIAPAFVATVFATLLFAPSYWRYEPRQGVEGFDLTLTLLAVAAAFVVAAGVLRAARAWLSARRRVKNWLSLSHPITLAVTSLPTYEVDVEQPILALVGAFRPKLLVTRGLIKALTGAELDAAVAHEIGHQRGFDNLKRLLMCAAPDLLAWSRVARQIERRWAAAAEHLADRINGPDVAAARCALASALVKVARLTPPATAPYSEPISSLISGGEIAARVQRLLSDDQCAPSSRKRVVALGIGVAIAAGLVSSYSPLLRQVHEITETLVRSLP